MEDEKYTRITLRIPRDLHEMLSDQAERTSKSMNAEIIARLEASFSRAPSEEMDKLAHEMMQRIIQILEQDPTKSTHPKMAWIKNIGRSNKDE